MVWTRWIILAVPTALGLLAWWSADQAVASRKLRGEDVVVATGEGIPPTLNPFLPVCEVDRQVAELVHEPLVRVGEDGQFEGALAEKWVWTQGMSFWFANESYAAKAEAKLKKMTPEQWAPWQLISVQAVENELRLLTGSMTANTGAALWEAISEFGPLPVETLRVDLKKNDAHSHHDYFMQNAVESGQVKAAWFDGAGSYELRISGETVKFFQELEMYYRNHPALEARLRVTSRASWLSRPQLDFVIKDGATFHDGSAVTAGDVQATVNFALAREWPLRGREALRNIGDWDVKSPRLVRVGFRELYGPSMVGFVGLPILQKAWIDQQNGNVALPFLDRPPSGAGSYRLEGVTDSALFLRKPGDHRRVQFLLDQPARAIRMGFAMKIVDIFWPSYGSLPLLAEDNTVTLSSPAPRSRLLVLWNCRQAPLNDLRVREALGKAVDRETMLREVLHGQGSIDEGIFQPGLWFSQSLPAESSNPLLAKQMLYDAGWARDSNGILMKSGKPLKLELLTVADNPERMGLAERLRAAWAAIGVEVIITAVPWAEMLDERMPSHRFDAALIGLDFETTWDQSTFWHSRYARQGLNISGVSDAELDTLLDSLKTEFDPQRVKGLARSMESRLLALHPFLPLFSGGSPLAIRNDALPKWWRDREGKSFSLRRALQASKD